jgi:manganese efflux pump family protein
VAGLVIWLLVIQVGGGVYMFTYTLDAGMPESGARATRLPAPVLLLHPVFGLSAVAVWLAYMATDGAPLPWVTFGLLACGGLLGAVLGLLTVRPAPDPLEVSPHDPGAAQLAEKRIPDLAIALHGTLAVLILVCVLLVALGVGV